MKTLLDIAKEHIQKTGNIVDNPVELHAESVAMMKKMQTRFQNDPALGVFTMHFSLALEAVLKAFPAPMHVPTIQSLIVQVVIEWEEIVREYAAQIGTQPPMRLQDIVPPKSPAPDVIPLAGETRTENVMDVKIVEKELGRRLVAELDAMITTAKQYNDTYGRDKTIGLIAAQQKVKKVCDIE